MRDQSHSKPSRRKVLKQLSAVGAASSLSMERFFVASSARAAEVKPAEVAPVIKNRAPLVANAFYTLPLGAIRPAGWLKEQLQIQADGLGGHLDDFWADANSNCAWLGGPVVAKGTDGDDPTERLPYYLDGLVPLAYLLDDPRLKLKVQRIVDWSLAHQDPNGMLGPLELDDKWWSVMVMLKALSQYQEATGDERVIPAMDRFCRYQFSQLSQSDPQYLTRYRWQEEVVSLLWLYNRTGSGYLLDLAKALREKGHDWTGQFESFKYHDRMSFPKVDSVTVTPLLEDPAFQETHGVNLAEAIKQGPLWFLISRSEADRLGARKMIATLDQYHGLPNGMYSCSEHLGGRNPSQGSELCSVVEYMFSLEQSLAIVGDPAFGDRLERLAFNALPGTLTDDMWAHQYLQESNQVECSLHQQPWVTDGPESNLFGLQPNDGCCTANFSQGWPKFATSLFMLSGSGEANQDDGLVVAAYAPCEVTTTIQGTTVHIVEETEYPFKGLVRLTVNPATPQKFPLQLRIPGWAAGTEITVNGQRMINPQPGSFARIERAWRSGDRVELNFPMQPRTTFWQGSSVAVERGPLVFSLPIGEAWVKLRDRGMTADWQVYPTTRWNYALSVADEKSVQDIAVTEKPVGKVPFSARDAAVSLQVKGRILPTWIAEEGVASAPPESPVVSDEPEETLTLIPYAAAKLRITAFPRCTKKSS